MGKREEIEKVINDIKPRKAIGPDQIHGETL